MPYLSLSRITLYACRDSLSMFSYSCCNQERHSHTGCNTEVHLPDEYRHRWAPNHGTLRRHSREGPLRRKTKEFAGEEDRKRKELQTEEVDHRTLTTEAEEEQGATPGAVSEVGALSQGDPVRDTQ